MARDSDSWSGRYKKGTRQKKSNVSGSEFQPRNMLGHYEVKSPFLQKSSKSEEMWIEIHELVESGNAFFATFDFGIVSGVMLLAGSRRALQHAVQDADEDTESETEADDDEDEAQSQEDDADTEQVQDEEELDSFERPPDIDRPGHAFEKNTFRNPKWFAQWRGKLREYTTSSAGSIEQPENEHDTIDHVSGDHAAFDGASEDNKAHFEFSTAACRDFEATFSCPFLGAKEVAVQGWKSTNKPTPAVITWSGAVQ